MSRVSVSLPGFDEWVRDMIRGGYIEKEPYEERGELVKTPAGEKYFQQIRERHAGPALDALTTAVEKIEKLPDRELDAAVLQAIGYNGDSSRKKRGAAP